MVSRIRETKQAEADAREAEKTKNFQAEEERSAPRRGAEITAKRMERLRSFSSELDSLTDTPDGMSRADTIVGLAQIFREPEFADALLANPTFTSEQDTLVRETRSKVANKAIAKRDAIASALLDRRQNEYRKWATERSEHHRQRIEQLGFPVRYLDAVIYIGSPNSAKPFVTLRQLAAVLFEQGKGVVSGFHFTNDDYGLSYKVPGARSSTYGFQLDGGELYLTRYMIGDDHEFLSSPWERVLIQGQLTRLVEWPEFWNAPSVIPQQKRSAIEPLPSASQDKPASIVSPKFDPRFTPDEIAKRLDSAREKKP